MTRVDAWVTAAVEDAERRGLPQVKPLLEGLARATVRLRGAGWYDRVSSRVQSSQGATAAAGEGEA